jgi:hypothetical protein
MDQVTQALCMKLCDYTYISNYNKTQYTDSQVFTYMNDNKDKMKDWFVQYINIQGLFKKTTIDEFCQMLLSNLQFLPSNYKKNTVSYDRDGNYDITGYVTDKREPYWYPVDVTFNENDKLVNKYLSPVYQTGGKKFLPSQYAMRTPYAEPYLMKSIELTQNPKNNFVRTIKPEIPVTPKFIWSYVDNDIGRMAKKYKDKIPAKLFDKIVRNEQISIYEYLELTYVIPKIDVKTFLVLTEDPLEILFDNERQQAEEDE